jgi:DNA repair protein RadC
MEFHQQMLVGFFTLMGGNMDNSHLKTLIQTIIKADESLIDIVLHNFPTVSALLNASKQDFQSVKGITPSKALKLYSTFQIAKEIHRPREPKFIRSPHDIYDLLSTDLRYLQHELFVCVFLNSKNHVIGTETLSVGSLNTSVVHPREVYKSAIKRSCASIICVHNHPSGDPTPSREDIELTERLIASGKIVGIDMLDHVILGGDSFYSLKEQGVI